MQRSDIEKAARILDEVSSEWGLTVNTVTTSVLVTLANEFRDCRNGSTSCFVLEWASKWYSKRCKSLMIRHRIFRFLMSNFKCKHSHITISASEQVLLIIDLYVINGCGYAQDLSEYAVIRQSTDVSAMS